MAGLRSAALAAAVLAAAALGSGEAAAQAGSPGLAVALPAWLGLVVAVAAFALAAAAFLGARSARGEIERLARAVDGALARIRSQTTARPEGLVEMEGAIRAELEALAARIASRDEAAAAAPPPSGRRAGGRADTGARAREQDVEAALAAAIAAASIELSLQPIVSVSANAAAGFEAFARLELAGGRTVDVGRPAAASALVDHAAFESLLVLRAAEVGRRQLGADGTQMPLHCPVSAALLDDPRRAGAILELLTVHPVLQRSLVLSAPSALLLDTGRARRESLEPFVSAGTTFAAEGWDGKSGTLAALRASAVSFIKLDAHRLLDRDKARRKAPSGVDIVAEAGDCGIRVVATGVASDEDAVNLLDIGVDLMAGERFGLPRRLRGAGKGARTTDG